MIATLAALFLQGVFAPPPSPAEVVAAAQAQGLIPSACPSGAQAASPSCFLVPSAVQVGKTTTDSTAHFSITWARSFVSSTPWAIAVPVDGQAAPIQCRVSIADSVHVEGDCFQSVRPTVQGVAIGATAVASSPVVATGAGVDVRVAAREPTQ